MNDRVVFDCMVYLQAATNENGPAFACFRMAEEGQVTLCVSAEVLAEVQDVLSRPALKAKFPHLTPELIETFLQRVRAKALALDEIPKVIFHPRDPDDEPYLNLAVAAGARFLVSRDKDLLDLMSDSAFRSRSPGLVILDPIVFLREIRALREETITKPAASQEKTDPV